MNVTKFISNKSGNFSSKLTAASIRAMPACTLLQSSWMVYGAKLVVYSLVYIQMNHRIQLGNTGWKVVFMRLGQLQRSQFWIALALR
jgi:hypothetical protein